MPLASGEAPVASTPEAVSSTGTAASTPDTAPNPALVLGSSNAVEIAVGDPSPLVADKLIQILAEGRVNDIQARLQTRSEAQYRKILLDQGLSPAEAEAELIDKFTDKRSEIQKKASELDTKIQESKAAGGEEGATGHDIEIHLLNAELYPTQLVSLQAERDTPGISAEKAVQLDSQIAKHTELAALKTARENLKDANGVVLPDQVVGTISKIATDAERPEAKQNPIGYLQTKIGGAMRQPETRAGFIAQLVASGMIDQADTAEVTALLSQADKEDTTPEKRKMNKAVAGLGIAGLLMFLMFKMAAGSAGNGKPGGQS